MKRTVLTYAHTFIFALLPVLPNCLVLMRSQPLVVLKELVILMALTAVLLRLLRPVIPIPGRRALFLSALYMLFFNFRTIRFALRPSLTLSTLLGQRWFVALSFIALCAVLIWLLRRPGSPFLVVSTCANICAVAFLGVTVHQVTSVISNQTISPTSDLPSSAWQDPAQRIIDRAISQEIIPPQVRPDIYYIILDGYARADVLKEIYAFDNSEFAAQLRNLGFYIVEGAQSNYSQTYLSLASSLNLDYLDELQATIPARDSNRQPLAYLIERNAAARVLRRAGYKFVLVGSDFAGTRSSPQADVCHCSVRRPSTADDILLMLTPLWLWLGQDAQVAEHRDRILDSMSVLNTLEQEAQPLFVFAHIIAPHPPFVLNANGEAVADRGPFSFNDGSGFYGTDQEYIAGYRQQLTYVNARTLEFVRAILRRSTAPPIIILQADHGPGSRWDVESAANTDLRERLGIFAAYHLPDDWQPQLTRDFTPVNTFRLIFDNLLGTHYGLLPNKSYFSKWSQPYNFEPILAAEAQVWQ